MIFKKTLSVVLASLMLLSVVPVMAEEAALTTQAPQEPIYRVEPEHSGTLYDTSVFEGHATYLIEDDFFESEGVNIPETGNVSRSGWDIDYRGGSVTKKSYNDVGMGVFDFSETERITLSRKMLPHKSGEFTFEAGFAMLIAPKSGFSYDVMGEGKIAAHFETENDTVFLAQPGGKKVTIGKYTLDKDFVIKAVLNLDTKRVSVYSQNKYVGEFPFTDSCDIIDEVFIATPVEGTVDVRLKFVNAYVNYLVNDRFMTSIEDSIPEPWTVDSLGQGNVYVEQVNSGNIDDRRSLKIYDAYNIDNSVVSYKFAPQTKKVRMETKFIVNPESENFSIGLNSGNKRAIEIVGKKNNFYTTGGKEIYTGYRDNLWYYVDLIADVETQTADIYLNYNLVADDVPFANKVSNVDTYVAQTGLKEKATFWIDDIMVYQELPLYADYVPAPKKVESEGVDLAMMMYSMWREGNHYGWDKISSFKEREPYLGWYTEGSTEVADWEIKWLVEHGFDYQVYPWARDTGNANNPIKNVQRYHAADAFLKAEYRDQMKFAIMHSYMKPDTLGGFEDWKNNIIPYWIEYYFKNPNYMIVNNRPIIYYYGWGNLLQVFGGLEGAKQAFDYLHEECRKLGFDGAMIVGSEGDTDGWKTVGATHSYVYATGHKASSYSTMKNVIDTRLESAALPYIPSIAMGWDREPWVTGESGRFAEPSVVGKLTESSIKKINELEAAGKDTSKQIIYTCWNEWGEGHFYCPSTAHGFGYLQEIRNAATTAGYNPEEVVPTERAKARIQVLYPPERGSLKVLDQIQTEPYPEDIYVLKGWYFDNPEDFAQWKIEKDIEYIKNEDGKLIGKSNAGDPSIINEGISIPLKDVVGIRSNLWVDGGATGTFFYHTDLEAPYGQGKKFDAMLFGDGYTTYFAPPADISKLEGATMIGLRFDPDDGLFNDFGDFGLKFIEVIARKPKAEYYINGFSLNRIYEPKVKEDGLVYMSAYRILQVLNCGVVYTAKDKSLTVKKDGKTVILKDGSNIANINGVDTVMPGTAYYDDGHFMVPMNYICDLFGFTITNELPKEEEDEGEKIPFHYDFNSKLEGWNTSGVAFAKIEDGAVHMKAVSTDPILQFDKINIDAATYNKTVKVRMKNTTGATTLMLYFLTDSDPNWGGDKKVEMPISDTQEWQEYTFDVSSNSSWKGTITTLRVDPTVRAGDVYIDYIYVD